MAENKTANVRFRIEKTTLEAFDSKVENRSEWLREQISRLVEADGDFGMEGPTQPHLAEALCTIRKHINQRRKNSCRAEPVISELAQNHGLSKDEVKKSLLWRLEKDGWISPSGGRIWLTEAAQ